MCQQPPNRLGNKTSYGSKNAAKPHMFIFNRINSGLFKRYLQTCSTEEKKTPVVPQDYLAPASLKSSNFALFCIPTTYSAFHLTSTPLAFQDYVRTGYLNQVPFPHKHRVLQTNR